jgi:hypothetical protein
MAPPAVGTGTLRRLSALDTGGQPVLSVYLGLELARSGKACARAHELELDAVIAEIEQRTVGADVSRLSEALRCMPALAGGTRGLALFSSAQGAAFAGVPLPSTVETIAVIDPLPWLEPLAGTFSPGDRGVAVVDRHAGRLFRGAPRMLVEFATVRDRHHDRPALGDCTQPNGPCPTQEDPAEHARRLAGLLLRAHRRRPFEELAVFAPTGLWPAIEASLQSDLRSRLTALVDLELIDATAQEIAHALSQHARSERAAHSACSSSTRPPLASAISTAHHATILTVPEPTPEHALTAAAG